MKGLSIKGVFKTSMLDYPDRISAVLFVAYCNFRCPFCHNPELISSPEKIKDVDVDELFTFLKDRKRWLDGVVITGGEPTMHPALPEFIRKLKNMGFLVKVDTNGTNPEMIELLLKEKLVDYIAMDIKSHYDGYNEVTCTKVNMNQIKRSIDAIMKSNIDYEFRLTAVPGLFAAEDAKKIGEMLKGARKFCLQQFRNDDKVLDPRLQDTEPFRPDELKRFADVMKPYFNEVEVRGI